MRTILAIALSVVVLLVALVGVGSYWSFKTRHGNIKNWDFSLVHVSNKRGEQLFDLHRGESRYLGYGDYQVAITDASYAFTIWKNNRGNCDIHSSNGVPVIETDGNCGVYPPDKKK